MEYEIKIGNRTRKLEINLIPYSVHKLLARVESRKAELMDLAQEESILNQRILELRRERPEGWFVETMGLRSDIRKIGKEAKDITNSLFFDDRFEAVRVILLKNGIKEDDKLMDRKLWEEDLDVKELNDFLEACRNKDKKKDTLINP